MFQYIVFHKCGPIMCSLVWFHGLVTSCFQMNDNSRTVTGGPVFQLYKYMCGCHLQSQRESSEHLEQIRGKIFRCEQRIKKNYTFFCSGLHFCSLFVCFVELNKFRPIKKRLASFILRQNWDYLSTKRCWKKCKMFLLALTRLVMVNQKITTCSRLCV